jgi:DNA repair exonuclease SbcCD ATPase subunit
MSATACRWPRHTEEEYMNPPKTTVRPSVDLDATDELPVLDPAAYEAEILSREAAGLSDDGATATQPALPITGSPTPERSAPTAAAVAPAADADVVSAIESWIAEKTEELRAHHDALNLAQHERSAAMARAGALSRELAETSANFEALNGRERALAEALASEQQAAQMRAVELDSARHEAVRLAQQLVDARAAELQQNSALAASATLLDQRSAELQTLQRTHETLLGEQQRTTRELAELETRLRDSESREREARRTIESQNLTHTELTRRAQQEVGARERLAAEVTALQGQLAKCVESLHNRESYRAIYESTLQELDVELAAAKQQTAVQETRANQLSAELQSRDRGLKDAVRELDQARLRHDSEITQRATERGEGERKLGALESRVAELTAQHADASAQRAAIEATLAAAQQRAEAEAAASGAAGERLRELETAIASRQAELTNMRLESERNRALLADLTAALLKSQTMCSDQGRLLEEREAAATTMAASHAEQTSQMTLLRGQVEELSARLAAPDAERRALEEKLAALSRELAESESRGTRLESMITELRSTVGQLDTLVAERDAELQRATQMASMNAYALGRVQTSIDELGRTLTASESASAQAQVSILTRVDNGQNHSVVLRGRTTMGRDRDNDLPLAMRSVSRHHAVIIPGFRTAFVQDLSSTNGVLVNQRRVRCARLEHGDMISLGEAQFRYTVTPAPAGPPSAGSTSSSGTRASLKHVS